MERHGEEVHIETDEARGGETSNVMRWVLAISVLLAIGLLSAIWITAASTRNQYPPKPGSETVEQEAAVETDTIEAESANQLDSSGEAVEEPSGAEVIGN